MSGSVETIAQERRGEPHQLIEVLQDIQATEGYLSEEAMNTVSRELGVPVMEVFRVANFYKAFSLEPMGKHVVTLCMGTACHVRGDNPLLDQALSLLKLEEGGTTADGLFTVQSVNCLGACALAPLIIMDGVYHHNMTPAKLRSLINKVRKMEGGQRDV